MDEFTITIDEEFLKDLRTEFRRLWSFSDLVKILSNNEESDECKPKEDSEVDHAAEKLKNVCLDDTDKNFNNADLSMIDVNLPSNLPAEIHSGLSERLIDTSSLLIGDTGDLGDTRTFQELNLCELVHHHIMRDFRYLMRSQMCIPLILNKRNFVLIAPPGSRKTSGYLIALSSIVLSSMTSSSEPECVIIAPNFKRMNRLYRQLDQLFHGSVQVVVSLGDSKTSQKHSEISKCHIVITSPVCFLKMFGTVFHGDCLVNITFDSASELFSIFPNEIEDIYQKTSNIVQHYMVISNKYHTEIGNFYSKLSNPVFCSISFMESALFAGVRSSLILTKKPNKMDHLNQLLGQNKLSKVVIMCSKSEEVEMLVGKFKNPVLSLTEHSNQEYLRRVAKIWSNKKFLICTDQILYDINITDADCLIHYSIPKTRDIFSHRYSLLKDKFVQNIKNNLISSCHAYILIDEEGLTILPQLYKYATFFEDHNIPKDVEAIASDVLEINESSKKSKICLNILKFGFCRTNRCSERHIINRYRDINMISDCTYISFVITCIHDISHYSARITGYSKLEILTRNFESKFSSLPSDFVKLGMAMRNFFIKPKNRVTSLNPSIGDLVMLQRDVELFMRGKIIKIIHGRCNFISKYVVKLIDQGETYSVSPESVYYLPKNFRSLPPQVAEIFISNLLPADHDNTWSVLGTYALRNKYNEIKNEDIKIMSIGKVNEIFGKYFIIEDWMIHNMDNSFTTRRFSVREFIIKNKYGFHNADHLSNLDSFCIADPLEPEAAQKTKFNMNLIS